MNNSVLTTQQAWTLARRRSGLSCEEMSSTVYLGGDPDREHETLTEAEVVRRVRERSVREWDGKTPLACICCGKISTHIDSDGDHYVACARLGKSDLCVAYCAEGCERGSPVLLADGPNAGGFIVWRCACVEGTSWPKDVSKPDQDEDLLSANVCWSSHDNVGLTCTACGTPRGEFRWGLFD